MSTGEAAASIVRASGVRDVPAPDVRAEAASDMATEEPVFCGQCGGRIDETSHERCRQRAVLEPPRYCARCRRRMVVQVTPTGWWARCVEHGTTTSAD